MVNTPILIQSSKNGTFKAEIFRTLKFDENGIAKPIGNKYIVISNIFAKNICIKDPVELKNLEKLLKMKGNAKILNYNIDKSAKNVRIYTKSTSTSKRYGLYIQNEYIEEFCELLIQMYDTIVEQDNFKELPSDKVPKTSKK